MLISFCSCCLHTLDDYWSLWKSLRATTPLVWRKSSSWGKMNWKKCWITCNCYFFIRLHILPFSFVVFLRSRVAYTVLLGTEPHAESLPSLLAVGWPYRAVYASPLPSLMLTLCCHHRTVACLEGSSAFSTMSWPPLHALWSAQRLLSFKQSGDQSSLAYEAFTFNLVSCI